MQFPVHRAGIQQIQRIQQGAERFRKSLFLCLCFVSWDIAGMQQTQRIQCQPRDRKQLQDLFERLDRADRSYQLFERIDYQKRAQFNFDEEQLYDLKPKSWGELFAARLNSVVPFMALRAITLAICWDLGRVLTMIMLSRNWQPLNTRRPNPPSGCN